MVEHWFMNHEDKIYKIVTIIVLIICIIIYGSLYITKSCTGKSTLFGYQPYLIMSDSMEPTIMTHQLVIATPIDAEDICVGDIVSYKTDTKTIIHRVIGINKDGTIEFQGDNNEFQIESDKRVLPEQILCKVIKY